MRIFTTLKFTKPCSIIFCFSLELSDGWLGTLIKFPKFQEDRIGLKTLDESGRLDLVEVEGDHLQIGEERLVSDFIMKYLA